MYHLTVTEVGEKRGKSWVYKKKKNLLNKVRINKYNPPQNKQV